MVAQNKVPRLFFQCSVELGSGLDSLELDFHSTTLERTDIKEGVVGTVFDQENTIQITHNQMPFVFPCHKMQLFWCHSSRTECGQASARFAGPGPCPTVAFPPASIPATCPENEESRAGDADRKLPCDPYPAGGPLQRLRQCQAASPRSGSKMADDECARPSAAAARGSSRQGASAPSAAPIPHRERHPAS